MAYGIGSTHGSIPHDTTLYARSGERSGLRVRPVGVPGSAWHFTSSRKAASLTFRAKEARAEPTLMRNIPFVSTPFALGDNTHTKNFDTELGSRRARLASR